MVAVGMLLVWGGYSVGLWGWCLFRDYDVTFGQLVSPTHPYPGPWPPAKIPAGQTWPGGTGQATQATPASPAPSKAATAAKAASGSSGIITKINEYLPGLGIIK
jgi:hypothetical protein